METWQGAKIIYTVDGTTYSPATYSPATYNPATYSYNTEIYSSWQDQTGSSFYLRGWNFQEEFKAKIIPRKPLRMIRLEKVQS